MVATKKLKIGLVIDDSLDKPDGVQQYVLALGAWLSSRGHKVHYLAGQSQRQDLKNLHSLSRNFKVRFNGNRMTIPLPVKRQDLQALLNSEHYDVLHVQLPHSPFLAHRLVRLAAQDTAVLGTFHIAAHSRLVSGGTRLLGAWTRGSIKRFDKIISVSPAARALAEYAFMVKTDIVPNMVDYDYFASAKPLAEYQNKTLTILFLGRLVPRKGCLQLLRAVNLLAQRSDLPAFRVLICGRGPLESRLRDYVTKHNLAQLVEFKGFVSEKDKPRYYASADIAVFPSTGGESFGIVLIEAMAAGKGALLAGDNNGYRSVMESRTDLLFDPYNIGELAQKLAWLLTDSKARRQAASWGRRHGKKYALQQVGPKIEAEYYRALLKKRGQ